MGVNCESREKPPHFHQNHQQKAVDTFKLAAETQNGGQDGTSKSSEQVTSGDK